MNRVEILAIGLAVLVLVGSSIYVHHLNEERIAVCEERCGSTNISIRDDICYCVHVRPYAITYEIPELAINLT